MGQIEATKKDLRERADALRRWQEAHPQRDEYHLARCLADSERHSDWGAALLDILGGVDDSLPGSLDGCRVSLLELGDSSANLLARRAVTGREWLLVLEGQVRVNGAEVGSHELFFVGNDPHYLPQQTGRCAVAFITEGSVEFPAPAEG